jgi:hypothetical protein
MKNNIFFFKDNFIEENLAPTCGAVELNLSYFRENLFEFKDSIFIVRGVTNNKYCRDIRKIGANYLYIDTGYFGNFNSYYSDKAGWKKSFHRIVLNQMQMSTLVNRKKDRYKTTLDFINRDLNLVESDFIKPWKKNGSRILICPPSNKVAAVFKIDNDEWIETTIKKIKKYSSRDIVIRRKPLSRSERTSDNPIQNVLDDDVFVLVTYNSIAATEAIMHGIPAVTLGMNAATAVSLNELKDIEKPIYPSRRQWLYNLSYGQFHLEEIQSGIAWKVLMKDLKRSAG